MSADFSRRSFLALLAAAPVATALPVIAPLCGEIYTGFLPGDTFTIDGVFGLDGKPAVFKVLGSMRSARSLTIKPLGNSRHTFTVETAHG